MIAVGWFDWVVVAWVLAVVFGVGLFFRDRASTSFGDFFLSGRSLPWWLLGTSMVATTFASDTPLWVTGQVRRHGIVGNWLWWSFLIGTTMTAFFFAKLWRRAGFTTDVEFVALRYGGRAGTFLRGFRSLYMSFFFNGMILGWVMKAMGQVLDVVVGFEPGAEMFGMSASDAILYALVLLAFVYTVTSGLWGVVATDLLQFVLAMGGAIILAVLAWHHVGGIQGLEADLIARFGEQKTESMLAFLPSTLGGWGETTTTLALFYFAAQWWATMYPSAEPGGGTYVAQRILAARSETDARLGTVLFAVANYALRPWPWIIVALFAAAAYAPTGNLELGYANAMVDLLPPGLLGLMLAAFFAAFMSTVDTQLTLGGAYLVNDFYRPFVQPNASERHYVLASRVAIALLLVTGVAIAKSSKDVNTLWELLITTGAGSGLVLILRWYWWRISAFTEISAMFASMVFALAMTPDLQAKLALDDTWIAHFQVVEKGARLWLVTGLSTLVWVTVTFLTPPSPDAQLDAFYAKVRPGGFWGPVARRARGVRIERTMLRDTVSWLLATAFVYSLLFGFGCWLFDDTGTALVLGGVAAVTGCLLWGNEVEDLG